MRVKFFPFVLLALMLCTALDAAPRYCKVKLVQWNLRIGIDMTWQYDLKRQADVLNKLDGDIIVLNEIDKNCARTGYVDMTGTIATLTGMCFSQFSAARALPPEGLYGNAILSRYRMEVLGAWIIPALPEEPRNMTLVKIYTSNPFLVALTHLNHRNTPEGNAARVNAVNKIMQLVDANNPDKLPVVMVGDFNCYPDSDPVRTLAAKGWKLEKPMPTYPSKKPVSAIDHIFVSDARAEVFNRIAVDEKIASDHIPVVNELRIYRNKERK